jgi:hypothetical protein
LAQTTVEALIGGTPRRHDVVSDGLLMSAYLGGQDLEAVERLITLARNMYNGSFGHRSLLPCDGPALLRQIG